MRQCDSSISNIAVATRNLTTNENNVYKCIKLELISPSYTFQYVRKYFLSKKHINIITYCGIFHTAVVKSLTEVSMLDHIYICKISEISMFMKKLNMYYVVCKLQYLKVGNGVINNVNVVNQ